MLAIFTRTKARWGDVKAFGICGPKVRPKVPRKNQIKPNKNNLKRQTFYLSFQASKDFCLSYQPRCELHLISIPAELQRQHGRGRRDRSLRLARTVHISRLSRRLTRAEILSISKGASKAEVKKAYHKVRYALFHNMNSVQL